MDSDAMAENILSGRPLMHINTVRGDISAARRKISRKKPETIFFSDILVANTSRFAMEWLTRSYRCTFRSEGNVYFSIEHYIQCEKVRFFLNNPSESITPEEHAANEQTYEFVLKSLDIRKIREATKKIHGYNHSLWKERLFRVAVAGNLLKLDQHPQLKDVLLSTGHNFLVEATNNDRIWGIGFPIGIAHLQPYNLWGLSLYGKALQSVRSQLRKQLTN